MKFILYQVRYIPELKRNLILLGSIESNGYVVNLKNGKAWVIISALRKGNTIYVLDGQVDQGGSVDIVHKGHMSSALLWHMRLGHMSIQGMIEL